MTRLSIPHSDYSPEMHALLCDLCPRCGTCMGDDAHDDLELDRVCDACCVVCAPFSDVPSQDASDGGGDRSPRPERVTATTSSAIPDGSPIHRLDDGVGRTEALRGWSTFAEQETP